MPQSLTLQAAGVLEDGEGGLAVRARYPGKKKEKLYRFPRQALRPQGVSADVLVGQQATVTWNREGQITAVVAKMPEPERPITLDNAGDKFLNPYGFVSLPDREQLPKELKDGAPAGHDRYRACMWSGEIGITITTHSPLLLPDHARSAVTGAAGDKVLPVRVDDADRPILAGSAVKGALRSAYEAITNSRLGVFTGHDQRLAYRASVDGSISERLRPAIVTRVDTTAKTATLTVVKALHPVGDRNGQSISAAARLPISLARGHEVARGREVDAWVRLGGSGKVRYWTVVAYDEPGKLGAAPNDGGRCIKVRGRVHWTGSTFPAGGTKKKNERLFVSEVLSPDDGYAKLDTEEFTIDESLVKSWQAVIDSYDRAHEHDTIDDRLSKYGDYVGHPDRWLALSTNDTLFVELVEGKIVGLYPAMIGRKPYAGPPSFSLPSDHGPATSRDELSPADRVFGWVRQGADEDGVAHRGHLRVVPRSGDGVPSPDCVVEITPPLTLVALNGPKPSQALFYLGDDQGNPLRYKNNPGEAGYPAEQGKRRLRGRKVYLTHAETLRDETYWAVPENRQGPSQVQPRIDGRVTQTRYREYLRHDKDGGNTKIHTTISSWVKPGVEFRLSLHVDNLSGTELGALLWLLMLPEGAMHKLGLGKPLGFGAVRIDVDWCATRLFTGDSLLDRYRMLTQAPQPVAADEVKALREEYDALLGEHLKEVRAEFLNAAHGLLGAPVHYPRAGKEPRHTTYDWWVNNNKAGGPRMPLGELSNPQELLLPYSPDEADAPDTTGEPSRSGAQGSVPRQGGAPRPSTRKARRQRG